MDRTCPMCNTPMIERNTEHVCPRNEIGDCSYDPYYHELEIENELDKEGDRSF